MNKGIAIIAARGGSKGVPRKAVKRLGGWPLINWTLRAAVDSNQFDYIFVTTDDAEIEQVVNIDFRDVQVIRRPGYLATDWVQTDEVLRQALRQLFYESEKWFGGRKITVDDVPYVAFLDPTCPFRDKDDIAKAVSLYLTKKHFGISSTVLCVVRDRKFHWRRRGQDTTIESIIENTNGLFEPVNHDPLMRVGRQTTSSWLYRESGAVYIFDPIKFLERGNYRQPPYIGYLLDESHAIEIDELFDWLMAETMLKAKNHDNL